MDNIRLACAFCRIVALRVSSLRHVVLPNIGEQYYLVNDPPPSMIRIQKCQEPHSCEKPKILSSEHKHTFELT